MDPRIADFVKPLYLDLDGISHFDEVERVSRIARALYRGSSHRAFELLLLFHGLRKWLGKGGNFSRALVVLRGAVEEEELRSITRSLARLEAPRSEEEIALASAIAIDRAGVNAMIERFIGARRQGSSALEIARTELSRDQEIPVWMPEDARELLRARRGHALQVCRAMLEEA